MSYIDAMKNGFRVIHRNWQLILVQIGMMIVSFLGFFIIVGIPLAVAFIIFGIDLTGLIEIKDLLRVFQDPSKIVSRYFGLVLIVITSLLLYVVIAVSFGMYVFGGSVGVIGRAIQDITMKFSMRTFFHEAKKLFMRLFGFTAVIGIILIIAAFVLGILGGGIAALVSFARTQDSTLALFLGTFFSLILILLALIFILGILSITLYGVAALFFKDIGPVKSLREAINYLMRHPNALWLYAMLFGGYVFISFFLILFRSPFELIPVIGIILSFPFQLISYAIQTYIGLAIIAILFTYYYSTEIFSVPVAESSIPQDTPQEKNAIQDT
ncbi:MAG: hypothetical protein OEW69_01745 [Nitrospirota bacterium]|nr:hypothetical protein [Nitrospirota bacterium]